MDLAEAKQRSSPAAARHPWEIARLEVVRRLIARHLTLESGATVVDVGCGDGFVIAQLAGIFPGVLFYGVDTELSPETITPFEASLSRPNVKILSSLDRLTPPAGRVSLVLLMDVLEHVEHDEAFLAAIARAPYVDRDTRFLITVPAHEALYGAHDVFLQHYRRYSNVRLRQCAARAGLEVVDIGYFFASLLPLRILAVLRERLTPSRTRPATTGLATWQGSAAISTVLSKILVADAAIALAVRRIGLRLPGLSNYAVCRKPA